MKQIALSKTYRQNLHELTLKRDMLRADTLSHIPFAHTVKIKEIAKYRALIEYLTIAQRAGFIASQYDTLAARLTQMSDSLLKASDLFMPGGTMLDSVEPSIESARNALSDYLAAIEYLTVRPFVDLRRAIYTARGINDLYRIYDQLNDLAVQCGNGPQSSNRIILSLREQLGIPEAELDSLRPEERFNFILSRGNLPVSTQTTIHSQLAEVIASGDFFSASFNIGTQISNIAPSCNAQIDGISIRLVSKPGKKIQETGNASPVVSLFFGGQAQLLSCQARIHDITASIAPYSTYGNLSTFSMTPQSDSFNAGLFEVSEGDHYVFNETVFIDDVTVYKGLKGLPLMATYSIVVDPSTGDNNTINWDNVADIEVQIDYTTGSLGSPSDRCNNYD